MLAAEQAGFSPTGEFTQLNSYENRVYDLRLEQNQRVISKFYRPGRWSDKQILEEHQFLQHLHSEGLFVVTPTSHRGQTLFHVQDMWAAFFPRIAGRLPQELFPEDLRKVGRLLARIHNIGRQSDFQYRPSMHEDSVSIYSHLETVQKMVWPDIWNRYESAALQIAEVLEDKLQDVDFQRIHGDAHRGNLLHSGEEFFMVDFDDAIQGPVVQDFWMLLAEPSKDCPDLQYLLEAYQELADFPMQQLDLIPWLRAYRIISYSAWIAKRWQDPSFPRTFPLFQTYNYWAQECDMLERILWA